MRMHIWQGLPYGKMLQKVYYCDKCEEEVYSLLCRRIDGEDYDICSECYEKEVKE